MVRRLALPTLVLLALAAPAVALAAPAGSYKGKATSTDGKFRYGTVTFTVKGSAMKSLRIQGVTTSGCGGYKDVFVPTVKVKGNRFSATYTPVEGVDDRITVKGTFSGSKATGTFKEGPTCVNKGKFTAKRG